MKEYKRTYLASLPCAWLKMIICFAPSVLIGDVILCIREGTVIGSMVLGFIVLSFMLMASNFAVMALANFIINRFKSPSTFVDGKKIMHDGRSIELDRIKYVTLYLPELRSRTSASRQELSLYASEDEHVVIKRPSLSLIMHLKKECKNARFEIDSLRSRLITDIVTGLCVAVFYFVVIFAIGSGEK